MKRRTKRTLIGLGGVSTAAVLALLVYVQLRWDRTFDAPYPGIHASTDPQVIARGKYLAYGPAHCAYCHTRADQMERIDAGETPPLSGGYEFRLPLGTIRSPNLTPDPETGIGRRTDPELARTIRHGVKADGRALLPFMEFGDLSDEDLRAVISFLRSQPGVRHRVPPYEYNLVGRAVLATMVKPHGPTGTPPARAPAEGPSVERGDYLVNRVASCAGCHSNRAMDGSYPGPRLAGGNPMPMESRPGWALVPPNLTPDPATGHITRWTEDQFVARFRAGKTYRDSHMPWGPFGRMSDADLRSIYRYLRSVRPVRNATGPIVQPVKEG